MAYCRSCRAPILWLKTSTGKLMPVDLEPTDDGNIDVCGDEATVVPAERLEATRAAKIPLRKSHFAICPGAAKRRKPKKPKE